MKRRFLALFLTLCVSFSVLPAAVLAADGEGIPRGIIDSITLPETITVSVRSVTTLNLTISPNLANPGCTWTSSDPEVATVCSDAGGAAGNVTGISPGTATITAATDDGLSASCLVTVQEMPVPTGLEIESAYSVNVGGIIFIQPKLIPENATTLYSITADNSSVLDVMTVKGGSYVALRGLKAGKTEICIKTSNGLESRCSVRVENESYNARYADECGLLAYTSAGDIKKDLTHIELAEIIAALAGLKLDYADASTITFKDCNNLTDLQKAIIAREVEMGWINGTSESTFSPDMSVTRAQVAALIWRSMGMPATDFAFYFDDAPVYTWYYESLTSLYNLGIIRSTTSDIEPSKPASLEDALIWAAAARMYEIEKGDAQPMTELNLSVGSVDYIFWDAPDDEQTYIKARFCPDVTGWYEVITSGAKAMIDFYETENIEVVTDSWFSEYGPFGTYGTKAQLYAGESYTISIHPQYFGEGWVAVSLRGPLKIPTASINFETEEKHLYVGDTWTPSIRVDAEAASVEQSSFWATDYSVIRLVRGENGKYDTVSALSEGTATIHTTSYLTDENGNYCGYLKASCKIIVSNKPTQPPSSNGGSSSGGSPVSNTTTTTKTNADGSITITTTDSVTGIVTENTKKADGSQTMVETKKDGTITIITKTVDGSTGTVAVDTSGKTVAEVALSVEAISNIDGASVLLPITRVSATPDFGAAPTVTVITGSLIPVKVEIPVDNATLSTVAVIVNNDGTKEIIKTSVPTDIGLTVALQGDVTVRIVDNSKIFIDVPADSWAADAVSFCSARELFSGTSESTFAPEAPMPRAMMMTVLARFDGEDTGGGGTWYQKGMEWAITKGISDGSAPSSNITREQLVTMLWRYSGSPTSTGNLSGYVDAGLVSEYAEEAMCWAVANGIINGYGNGQLNPQGYASRAQVAQMLKNFIGA